MATLLCSHMIYNSLGTLDENAIQQLGFIANLAKHIKTNSGKEAGGAGGAGEKKAQTAEEMASLFPSFFWVLRDFMLELVDDRGSAIRWGRRPSPRTRPPVH